MYKSDSNLISLHVICWLIILKDVTKGTSLVIVGPHPIDCNTAHTLGKRMPASTRVMQETPLVGEVRLEHGRKEVRCGRM